MDWPPVIALIITYKRQRLALATIRSVKEYVDYPNIGFHIADDGSGPEHMAALREEIGGTYHVTSTDAERAGVGKSMNLGIQACIERADLWLHLEDDWVLTKPLDLRPCVQLLLEDPTVGMVRLGRLSAGLTGKTFATANKLWWRMDRSSDTYTFCGNAALRHRRFWDAYGSYKEGLQPGQTELYHCGKFNANPNGPDVVWPAWLTEADNFQHIGDHQSYKWWQERGELTAEEAAEKFEAMDKEAMVTS